MISLRPFLLAALCAAGSVGAAQAAIVRYEYQGQPLFCDGDPDSMACGGLPSQPGFFGQVTIDTAIFGAAGPSFVSIDADRAGDVPVYGFRAGSFDGGLFEGSGLAEIGDVPFFVAFSGSIGLFLQPGAVGQNSLFLGFDRSGSVIAWQGNDTDGGSTDQFISNEGDSAGGFGSTAVCDEGNICNRVPGTWTRTVIDADPAVPPAPVPLPAGMFLLGGALAALALRVRRRPT